MFSRVKPLGMNQRVLTWLCIHHSSANVGRKLINIIFSIICLSFEICGTAGSIVYFMSVIAIDLNETFYALFQIVAVSGVIYMYLVALLQRKKISTFIESLNQIFAASMNQYQH